MKPGSIPGSSPASLEQNVQAIRSAMSSGDNALAQVLTEKAASEYPHNPEVIALHELAAHQGVVERAMSNAFQTGQDLFGYQSYLDDKSNKHVVVLLAQNGSSLFASKNVMAALNKGYHELNTDPVAAKQTFTRALKRNPDAALYYGRVMADALTNDLKQADSDSMQAYRRSGGNPATIAQRANLLYAMGQKQAALAWAQKAYEFNKNDPDVLMTMGRCLWDSDDPRKGLPFIEQAAAIEPQVYRPYLAMAWPYYHKTMLRVRMDKQNWDDTALEAQTVLKRNPKDTDAHFALAMLSDKAGREEEVIRESTLSIKSQSPHADRNYFLCATAMEILGKRDMAIDKMRKAATLNPKMFEPMLDKLLDAKRQNLEPIWQRQSDPAVQAALGAPSRLDRCTVGQSC